MTSNDVSRYRGYENYGQLLIAQADHLVIGKLRHDFNQGVADIPVQTYLVFFFSGIISSKNQKTLTIKKKRRTSSKLTKKVSVEGDELHRFTKQLLFALEDIDENAVRSLGQSVYKVIGDPIKETSQLRKFHAKDCPKGCELPKIIIDETQKKNKSKERFIKILTDSS